MDELRFTQITDARRTMREWRVAVAALEVLDDGAKVGDATHPGQLATFLHEHHGAVPPSMLQRWRDEALAHARVMLQQSDNEWRHL